MITLLACLFFLAGAAGATAVYDNLSDTSSVSISFAGYGPLLYESFSTGAGGFDLSRVELRVEGSATPTGSFTVGLYSDNSKKPGVLLASFGTVFDSALTSTPSVVTLDLASPYLLAAGTRYWVELVSNHSDAAWMYSYGSGVGLAGGYWGSTSYGVWPNYDSDGFSNGPFQMQVSDDCSVPLPPSVWLLGSGLVGLIGFRRFRRS